MSVYRFMGVARPWRKFLARWTTGYFLVVILPIPWLGAVRSSQPPFPVSPEAAETAGNKFEQVLQASVSGRSFGAIRVSELEANSYIHYGLAPSFPPGLTSLQLELQPNRPQGWLLVDFDQLKGNFETPPNPLVDYLLQGEHTLGVKGTFRSSNGMGRFRLETVTLDGVVVPPFVVDFLIEHYLKARFPHADPNRPFRLPHSIEKIIVESGSFLMVGTQGGD